MFPEKPYIKPEHIIFRGFKAIISIVLTVDRVWRYMLSPGEKLTVEIRNQSNEVVISRQYTSEDVSPDKTIVVSLSESEVDELETNCNYYVVAYLDGYLCLTPKLIKVKEVVENGKQC